MENSWKTIELVHATHENMKPYGYFIDNKVRDDESGLEIPFYDGVVEGRNIEMATWKDQACVRMAQVNWKDDFDIVWMERHMDMTQTYFITG